MQSRGTRLIRIAGRIALFAAVGIGAVLLAFSGWLGWQTIRDPLEALPPLRGDLQVLDDTPCAGAVEPGRLCRRLVLADETGHQVSIAVNRPDTAQPAPALLLLAGNRAGQDTVRLIADPGPNVLIGYEYPFAKRWPRGLSALPAVFRTRQAALAVPGEAAAIFRWARRQAWVDHGRVAVAGFSLGALYVPATLHRAQADGAAPKVAVIGFGGAGLGAIFSRAAAAIPQPLSARAATALRPLEPAVHLPMVRATVLVIEADNDELMPAEARDRLVALLPGPKTVVRLSGDHVAGAQSEMGRAAAAIAREWLVETGAMNP